MTQTTSTVTPPPVPVSGDSGVPRRPGTASGAGLNRAWYTGVTVAVLLALLVGAAGVRFGESYATTDLLRTLVQPPARAGVLVRAVLLVGSLALAGLAFGRALTARRSNTDEPATAASESSPEAFAALFTDLSAKVSVDEQLDPRLRLSSDESEDFALVPRTPLAVQALAWLAGAAVAVGCVTSTIVETAGTIGQITRPFVPAQLVLALAVPVLIGSRRAVWPAGLAGLALSVLTGFEYAGGLGTARSTAALHLGYGVFAAIALGASVFAGSATSARHGATRRGDHAVIAAVVTTSFIGIVQLATWGPLSYFDLLHTGYGLSVLAQAGLPILGTAGWLLGLGAPTTPHQGRLARVAAGVMTLALLAGALVATFPGPLAPPRPGEPLLRPVSFGLRHLAVLVLPMRPGPNLVHIGDNGVDERPVPHAPDVPAPEQPPTPAPITVSVGNGPAKTLETRPGAPGTWAVVDIPAGTDRLTISSAGRSADIPVAVGSEPPPSTWQTALDGPDGPECASATLGALLGGHRAVSTEGAGRMCPSQMLTRDDVATLRAAIGALQARRVTTIEVVSDSSPRSRAVSEVVHAEAAARGIPVSAAASPGSALVVLSGWSGATAALDRVRPDRTILLAPWLLTTGVLAAAPSELVASTFDPAGADAQQYALALSTAFPGERPSVAGYLAWAGDQSPAGPAAPVLYTAAPVNKLANANDGMQTGHSAVDWYTAGSVTRVYGPLRARD